MIKIPDKFADRSFVDRVSSFFGEETPLRQTSNVGGRPYEDRPQQKQMAAAIADSFTQGEHACIEAATGTGKSFAYLIPAIFFAMQKEKPVIISTHTIALQEQLINRDIPVLKKLIDIPFKAALAKGRENYICRRRVENATGNRQEFLPGPDFEPEIERIARWMSKSRDGSRSDLNFMPSPQLWSIVCSEPGNCLYEKENKLDQCFFSRARKRLYNAEIIVANHALFCVDLAIRRESSGKQSILPDYAAVVIDEAHCFEDTAATHLGIRVSSYGITILMNRLFNPATTRGLLIRDSVDNARQAAVEARNQADRFMTRIRKWLLQQNANPLGYNSAGHIPNQLTSSWANLRRELKKIVDDPKFDEEYRMEIQTILNRIAKIGEGIDVFLSMKLADCVYWFESNDSKYRNIIFNVVPIEVNEVLRTVLFEGDVPVVLTSATLCYDNNLSYFTTRIGADSANTQILDSPFDYRNNVELYVPFTEMPNPKDRDQYQEAVCHQLRKFIIQTKGKAFVLFTSYAFMYKTAELLEEFFKQNDIRLFVQGRELQRDRMLQLFRDDINSVLFGTDSFWMGVDVPGETLSNVIIVKLPFAVPSHPLIAARKKKIEAKGGNSFRDYFLPEAVLKFRQGVGRLIRNRNDTGIVVVLDPRIVKTGYGKQFLNAVPECRRHIF